MVLDSGSDLGHYEILAPLGAGGMGEVYKARDTRLNRLVAIKLLRAERVADPGRKQRFIQEAQAASALNHPSIVTIYDIDHQNGLDYMVMEYVSGKTLADLIPKSGMGLSDALKVAVQISDALTKAHAAGIIHRDLKPSNVMISEDGIVKLLDFGLAKLIETSIGEDQRTRTLRVETEEGTIVGTAAYMSPEQVEGATIDTRSDIFSFGSVLYEMLMGRRAFQGNSSISTMSAILRDSPPPPRSLRTDIPAELDRILQHCLAKDRASRCSTAAELHGELQACQARLEAREAGLFSVLRQPRFAISACALLAAIAAIVTWFWVRSSRMNWAIGVALPEITRLADRAEYPAAYALATQAGKYVGANRNLAASMSLISLAISVQTNVPGADIYVKEYADVDSEWRLLGRSPLSGVRVPRGLKRWRVAKPEFRTIERTASPEDDGPNLSFTLDKEGDIPAGMVRIPGGSSVFLFLTGLDHLDVPQLGDYLMDRYEVSNREFAAFVAAGGYRKREFWKEPIAKDGRVLSWEQAMAEFRDSTGRPGPATWDLGNFPSGQGDFPVTGVSWFEAAAYAQFAGKSLPTIYHWNRAAFTIAGFRNISPVIRLSNFGGLASTSTGKSLAMNPYGTFDLAGNVKEWCWNAADRQANRRYILGGAWNEPVYMFNDPDAQSPITRLSTYGIRCVKYLPAVPAAATEPAITARRDYHGEKPASDDAFRIFRSFYAYDKTRLDPVVESTDDTAEYWKRERVSFNAAYGNERVTAYLYLPRNIKPPYQTVIFFPGSNTLRTRRYQDNPAAFDFIVRSGRALLFPVYKSTFERGDGLLSDRPNLSSGYRDHMIYWYKDFARSIDYLETRRDIDLGKLGHFGFSWGSVMGSVLLALDDRPRVAVWAIGGFWQQKGRPEVEQINFAPRVRIPVLMLNGKYDFVFPVDTSQTPIFRLLGTPDKDKRHLLFESGHSVPRKDLVTETLGWFDRYLGVVK